MNKVDVKRFLGTNMILMVGDNGFNEINKKAYVKSKVQSTENVKRNA